MDSAQPLPVQLPVMGPAQPMTGKLRPAQLTMDSALPVMEVYPLW
jgi:hypothetical protein